MCNSDLKEYLKKKSEEMALAVREFTDTAIGVYEGEADSYNDRQCRNAYDEAVNIVRRWLEKVLLMELMETGKKEVGVVLRLPNNEISVFVDTVHHNEASCDYGYCGYAEDIFAEEESRIMTPIGEMDYFTYGVVTGIKDNPVSLLYRHLGLFVNSIHDILGMPIHGEVHDVLSRELLAVHNIQDVLDVYKMDTLLCNVEAFFDGKLG